MGLGVAALQGDGTASLKLQFPPGQFSISAKFKGSSAVQPSISQPTTLTQLGQSTTALSINPDSNGMYTLAATVTGNQPQSPTGTVTFIDQTTLKILGSTTLQAGTAQSGFQPNLLPPAVVSASNDPLLVATNHYLVVSGDFNGDGIPDYAALSPIPNSGDYQLHILLGQANGSYQEAPASSTEFVNLLSAADVNNDGKTDLLASAIAGPASTTVFLSNGDGTFTAGDIYSGWNGVAGDFNGDGKPDLLGGPSTGQSSIQIYLGDGTGNFTLGWRAGPGGTFAPAADFNNDGNLDFIAHIYVLDPTSGAYVLQQGDYLGDGTGSFANISPMPILPSFDYAGMVADFNGDGNADLFGVDTSGNLATFLGDGTGNFVSPQGGSLLPSGPILGTYSTLDVNGDGIPDILGVYRNADNSYQVAILLGNGDDHFTPYNGPASTPGTPATYPLLGANGIVSFPASATGTASITVPHVEGQQIIAAYQGNGVLPPVPQLPMWAARRDSCTNPLRVSSGLPMDSPSWSLPARRGCIRHCFLWVSQRRISSWRRQQQFLGPSRAHAVSSWVCRSCKRVPDGRCLTYPPANVALCWS